jgi:ABC-type antimicrobial peptide transport system permease subunit
LTSGGSKTETCRGLSALDPLTYGAVAMTMVLCAALAGLAAAWRLRRMEPMEVLRSDG